jgi:hypothetical protein
MEAKDMEDFEDEIDEEGEFEEETDLKEKKDKVPVKSFAELIREYQKQGYSTKESMERAYRKMHPPPKPKVFDLYCMPLFPEINLNSYKNSYILVGNELKYINLKGKYESESVPITDMDVFLNEILEIDSVMIEKRHLSTKQVKNLITLNGGHAPQKPKKQSKKKVEEAENKFKNSN